VNLSHLSFAEDSFPEDQIHDFIGGSGWDTAKGNPTPVKLKDPGLEFSITKYGRQPCPREAV